MPDELVGKAECRSGPEWMVYPPCWVICVLVDACVTLVVVSPRAKTPPHRRAGPTNFVYSSTWASVEGTVAASGLKLNANMAIVLMDGVDPEMPPKPTNRRVWK